jgi:hypothetical protein
MYYTRRKKAAINGKVGILTQLPDLQSALFSGIMKTAEAIANRPQLNVLFYCWTRTVMIIMEMWLQATVYTVAIRSYSDLFTYLPKLQQI